MNIIQKIIGTKNEREIRKMKPIIARINELEPSMRELTDEDFPKKTRQWKEEVQKGRTLDDLLPEAFALVREAGRRVLGQRHFDVQMIGGMTLHSGRIAEMRTGEGKTLTATLPSYLNALSGRGVHVVTVNDYLARRDCEWMGRLHSFLGLSVGCILNHMNDRERQASYRADITYGQNNEFGFDYLRDNMKFRLEDYVQRELNFAIVDEVDSILIDEARTPLIISGESDESVDRYYDVDRVIPGLMPDQDYTLDEKIRTVTLTEEGVSRVEQRLGITNLYAPEQGTTLHHVEQALRAHTLFKRDRDYVVQNGEVLIVDEHTGRTLPGRRWSDGLHQAIEAKEGMKIESETQTLATISFQNYFRMYSKLSGMTGTADTEAEEFAKIYDLDVLVIPTNRPMIRQDNDDVVYKTEAAKFRAVAEEIEELHKRGQPVLVGTVSVAKSEALANILSRKGIPHEVLNAKQHAREADIIAQAGRKGAVTIATNMAGRGTDIILGGNPEFLAKSEVGAVPQLVTAGNEPTMEEIQEHQRALSDYKVRLDAATEKYRASCKAEQDEVKELGGLFILGTERHESRRIDNQLRGRAGRQGDPGGSRFYLSLEDDLMRIFGTDRLKSLMEFVGMEEDMPIEAKMLTNQIEAAQKQVEGRNFDARKHLLDYDDVMNQQRSAIYKLRRRVLAAGAGFPLVEYEQDPKNKKKKRRIETTVTWEDARMRSLDLIEDTIVNLCSIYAPTPAATGWDKVNLANALKDQLGISIDLNAPEIGTREDLQDAIWKASEENFIAKEGLIGAQYFRHYEQYVFLSSIDSLWKDHLLAMDHLRQGIGLRGYGHRDPKQEYKKEGYNMFVEMMHAIDASVVSTLMRCQLDGQDSSSASEEEREKKRAEVMSEFDLSKKRLPKMTSRKGDMITHGEDGQNASSAQGQATPQVPVRKGPRIRPNDPCYCGSGKKYKRCHGITDGVS